MLAFLILSSTLFAQDYKVEFLRCYDGDTCYFNIVLEDKHEDLGMSVFHDSKIYLKEQRVRFCDINAPEMHGSETEAATKARDTLSEWIRTAKTLTLQVPQKSTCVMGSGDCDSREKYGRWLGYVIADGVSLNARMVTEGLAQPYIVCRR